MKVAARENANPHRAHSQIPNLASSFATRQLSPKVNDSLLPNRQNHHPFFSTPNRLFSIPTFAYPHYFQCLTHSLPKTPRGGVSRTSPNPTSPATPTESTSSPNVPSNPFRMIFFRKSSPTPSLCSPSSLRTLWPSALKSPRSRRQTTAISRRPIHANRSHTVPPDPPSPQRTPHLPLPSQQSRVMEHGSRNSNHRASHFHPATVMLKSPILTHTKP
jgi:hypothetical protein